MPELPEVTVISEDVRTLALGKEVVRAEIFRDDVSNAGVVGFPERLVGKTLRGTGRRGKVIVLDFGDVVGLVHLVISGRVSRLPEWREAANIHTARLAVGGGPVLTLTPPWVGFFLLFEPRAQRSPPPLSPPRPPPFFADFLPKDLRRVFFR